MCTISNKIKFCTCLNKNIQVDELNHYWILHSRNKDKNMTVMGMPVIPDFLNPLFDINERLLVEVLNSPNAFDKDLNFKRGNRLEVYLCNHSTTGDELYFNFRYTGKQWTPIEADVF